MTGNTLGDFISGKSKEVTPLINEVSIFKQLIKERKKPWIWSGNSCPIHAQKQKKTKGSKENKGVEGVGRGRVGRGRTLT